MIYFQYSKQNLYKPKINNEKTVTVMYCHDRLRFLKKFHIGLRK